MKSYDIIWIGTGQAIGTALPQLVKAGKRVAVIEKDRFGGSCVNYGCTPTKTLVASARSAHMVRRASDFGVVVDDFSINFASVMKRMNSIRTQTSNGLESWITDMKGVDVYKGHAVFEDEHSVEVDGTYIKGENIVIHTGASPRTPDIPGLDSVKWLSNEGLLELTKLPEHLVVIGGSYIGLEFAQVFRRLGSRVTVLEASDQIMRREDEDVAQVTREVFHREGIGILEGVEIQEIRGSEAQVHLRIQHEGDESIIVGDQLLVGAGRKPNTANLGLEKTGVKTDQRGYVSVDAVLRTSVPHIYALGDVNGRGAFTHTSVNDGQIFLNNYLGDGTLNIDQRIPIYAMYTDPPLARIGMNEKEGRESTRNILIGSMPMKNISRAKEKAETDGLAKVLVDADSDEILGANVQGVGGDEIISVFAAIMYGSIKRSDFIKMVLPHPTVAELMPWILEDLKPL